MALFALQAKSYGQQNKISGVIYTSSSNEALSSLQQGIKFFDQNENKKAREYLQKAVQQDPRLTMGYLLLADQSNTPGDFVKYLDQAKENLATASEWEKLYYAYMETFLNDDMNKRIQTAQQMVSKFPDVPRAYVMKKVLSFFVLTALTLSLKAQPSNDTAGTLVAQKENIITESTIIKIENLGWKINSELPELRPTISADGYLLFFIC